MEGLFSVESAVALLTLTVLEIVLGIDNIVFISILSGKLPPAQQARARQMGLLAAMFMRIALLLAISWIMKLQDVLFTITIPFPGAEPFSHGFSGKDLILLAGGLFLIGKATWELHDKLEVSGGHAAGKAVATLGAVIVQVMLLDIVFSIDSVITAVGMAKHVPVMIAAIIISVIVMMASAGPVSRFIEHHPTIKILALSFLILIGLTLVVEGGGGHVSKGYIYFAMGFSLAVEMINIRFRKVHAPVQLHTAAVEEG